MSFALTKFIYPIEKELTLSDTLNYRLDNPRTSEEIELVKDFISESFIEKEPSEKSKIAPLPLRFAFALEEFKKFLNEETNSYALRYYSNVSKKTIIEIFAETWIIIRFDQDQEFDNVLHDRNELFNISFSPKNNPYSQAFDDVLSYCHLISLLTDREEGYYGESFILSDHPYDIFFNVRRPEVVKTIEHFLGDIGLTKYSNRAKNWLFWIDGSENILKESNRIEDLITQEIKTTGKKIPVSQKQTPKQKLFHIGHLLKTAYSHYKDPELMLLLLVSILEYYVTRNPDTSKFNVEDSISKQFKLKCAILIHNQDKSYDLTQLNQELTKIYSSRSDLAHGNYKDSLIIDEIVSMVYLLFKFNRNILNEYISDRNLVDYLKDN